MKGKQKKKKKQTKERAHRAIIIGRVPLRASLMM